MELKHVSPRGQARMVSVAGKAVTARSARAEAWVTVGPAIAAELRRTGSVAKGNVLETARLAGVMAAKRTSELIPMCHPLALELVEVEASLEGDRVRIETHATCEGKTGVEIGPVRLLEKSGGKSGTWRRETETRGNS